jgi:hypothetical protein
MGLWLLKVCLCFVMMVIRLLLLSMAGAAFVATLFGSRGRGAGGVGRGWRRGRQGCLSPFGSACGRHECV